MKIEFTSDQALGAAAGLVVAGVLGTDRIVLVVVGLLCLVAAWRLDR